MDLTPEQITEIAAKAAIAAVTAAMGGAQAPSIPQEPEAEDEEAAEAAAVEETKEAARLHKERVTALVVELVPLITQPRHLEVFKWFSGGDWAGAVTTLIRNEVARQMPGFREAHGGGGNSSRNLEALSNRLTPR